MDEDILMAMISNITSKLSNIESEISSMNSNTSDVYDLNTNLERIIELLEVIANK